MNRQEELRRIDEWLKAHPIKSWGITIGFVFAVLGLLCTCHWIFSSLGR
jgi:hypothetical protein